MSLVSCRLKDFFVFLCCMLFSTTGWGQIQGSVRDTTNLPVAYANVLLLNQKDSSIVSAVMATDEGTYNITTFRPGKYIIGASLIGYKPAYSPPFSIVSSNDHRHNDPIYLEMLNHQIQEVDVVAKKPVYELKVDRMVVNVENSITSSGNTALEVLEKSPGVVVDRQNNGISLVGKSGVMVIINGKRTPLPVDAAIQMLDGMNADNVKRIELITTPPAKYDAEGDAGIINIVLKKHEDFGTNGSFNLGAGVAKREKMNAGLNINHHTNKVNYYGTYNVNFNNLRQHFESYRRLMQSGAQIESDAISLRKPMILFQNIRMGFDYTISSKTTLSVLTNGYIRDWEMDAFNDVRYWEDQQFTKSSMLELTETNKWIHGMGNINLRHHFQEEEVLDFNFDYLNYYNDNPSDYIVKNRDNTDLVTSSENIKVTKTTPIDLIVGSLDYSNQFNSNFKLETGGKVTYTWFKNDIGVRYFKSGNWEFDPELTNNYLLNENIMAAYASLHYKIGDQTSIVGGLRYEHLNSVLDSETEKGIVDLHYGKLFPTFYLSQKLNEKNTIQFSYSRRIDRPTFNELAPFIILMTPETFISGNENLLPAFSNILKADYQYKSAMLSFSYTDTKDAISRFQPTYSEDETKQYFVSRNFDRSKTFSVLLAFPITVTDWWKMQNNFTWVRNQLKTDYEDIFLDIRRENYRINSSHSLTISKRVSGEVSGFFRSKSNSGLYERKPSGRLDIGVQWKLKNENSRFNLNVTDLLKTNKLNSVADQPELNIYTRWYLDFESRAIRLTFTHRFGNEAIKVRKRKTASETEQRRVN